MRLIKSVLCLVLVFSLSACTVRTYKLKRERVDQELSGNRGYLSGTPSEEPKDTKTHRTTQVVEVEFAPSLIFWRKEAKEPVEPVYIAPKEDDSIQGNRGYISGGPSEAKLSKEEAVSVTFEKYTVKKGDTLQKISKKYFNTTKKWISIYQVNRDILKSPDSIYPGQVINIPLEPLKEPSENLK